MTVSFLGDILLFTFCILVLLFVVVMMIWSAFDVIWSEFVETRRMRRYRQFSDDVEQLRGRRIRKVTAKKLVSAGLQPGVVVFATHSMGDEVWQRDVFIIRVPEDFRQCPFRKGMRFYRGKIEPLPVQHSK